MTTRAEFPRPYGEREGPATREGEGAVWGAPSDVDPAPPWPPSPLPSPPRGEGVIRGARRVLPIVAALFLSLAPPALAAEGRITAALTTDVPTLDPTIDVAPVSLHVRMNVFDALTEILADGSVGPRLATGWTVSPDATAWTFTLRRGAKFHNGEPVTIDDVVWTYQKVLADARAPIRTFIASIKEVEKVGEDQVRFTLNAPLSVFPRPVSLIYIVPRKAYEEMGAARFGQAPVGSGPYRLVRWVKDDSIEMEAFPDYWGGAAKLKTAVMKPVPSEASRAAALLSGELDIVPALPPAMVERLSSRPGIKVERADGYRVVYLGFNTADPVLSDTKLRLAIDHAIDREAITGRLLRGMGTPAGQIVAPVTFGYDPTVKPSTYDVPRARALLAESRYKGEKIPFHYPSNNLAAAADVVQVIAGYLTAIGISTELLGLEYNGFFPLWSSRKLPGMHMFANGAIMMDGSSQLGSLYLTGSRGYWTDPRVDEIIGLQNRETDQAKRLALMGEVWRISKDNAPYVMLYNERQAYGLRDGVSWSPRPDGVLRLNEIAPPAR